MSDTLDRPLSPYAVLDVKRARESQTHDELMAAIDEWRDAAGTGHYRLICTRAALRCFRAYYACRTRRQEIERDMRREWWEDNRRAA